VQNPQMMAQIRQQQMLAQQRQQQMMAAQGMYGNMAANGMQMGQPINQMNQMTAQQFAQMRNNMNAMRPVLPPHLQQAQHPGQNPAQQAVSCEYPAPISSRLYK
jgi:hypothetical protein